MSDENYAKLTIPKIIKRKPEVRALFDKFVKLFSFDGTFAYTNIMEHEITLRPRARPVKHK